MRRGFVWPKCSPSDTPRVSRANQPSDRLLRVGGWHPRVRTCPTQPEGGQGCCRKTPLGPKTVFLADFGIRLRRTFMLPRGRGAHSKSTRWLRSHENLPPASACCKGICGTGRGAESPPPHAFSNAAATLRASGPASDAVAAPRLSLMWHRRKSHECWMWLRISGTLQSSTKEYSASGTR